jgi:hypothetical protein
MIFQKRIFLPSNKQVGLINQAPTEEESNPFSLFI